MVAVDHEIRLPELHCDDRGKGTLGEGLLERAHAIAAERVQRTEVAGERASAAIGADEGVERNLTNAQIPAPERLQTLLDLVELEQAFAATRPETLHLESIVQPVVPR